VGAIKRRARAADLSAKRSVKQRGSSPTVQSGRRPQGCSLHNNNDLEAGSGRLFFFRRRGNGRSENKKPLLREKQRLF
jgi:hypothetical protein